MICQKCNEKEAVVQFTKIINGVKTEMHLCERCASQEALESYQVNVSGLIDEFLNIDSNLDNDATEKDNAELICPNCGQTSAELKKTGRLGCDVCYDTFADTLEPLIKRIHGRTVHTGKIAKTGGQALKIKREISEMQQKLDEAIRTENYELAAEYRDIIRLLKQTNENEPEPKE